MTPLRLVTLILGAGIGLLLGGQLVIAADRIELLQNHRQMRAGRSEKIKGHYTRRMGNLSALTSNEIEAANRAEATALLIRAGYRVYRPEADCYGEDLILREPCGQLRVTQLKSCPTVNRLKYGGKDIWMLFPDTNIPTASVRKWFLV